jgi:hypothetical protein
MIENFLLFFADLPIKSILKRKRSIEVTSDSYLSNDSMTFKDNTNGKEIEDDESINEDGGFDEQSAEGKRKKKARTTFTGRQIFELEKQFEVKKYLSSSERSEMAKLLNVTETQVRKESFFILLVSQSAFSIEIQN